MYFSVAQFADNREKSVVPAQVILRAQCQKEVTPNQNNRQPNHLRATTLRFRRCSRYETTKLFYANAGLLHEAEAAEVGN